MRRGEWENRLGIPTLSQIHILSARVYRKSTQTQTKQQRLPIVQMILEEQKMRLGWRIGAYADVTCSKVIWCDSLDSMTKSTLDR
jgi:hypothetical protein